MVHPFSDPRITLKRLWMKRYYALNITPLPTALDVSKTGFLSIGSLHTMSASVMDLGPELLARLPTLTSPLGIASVAAILLISLFITEKLLSVPYPPSIPLIREPEGARRFSLRTRWQYLTNCQPMYYEAYHKVHIPLLVNGKIILTHDSTSNKAKQSLFLASASE